MGTGLNEPCRQIKKAGRQSPPTCFPDRQPASRLPSMVKELFFLVGSGGCFGSR
jgi:hypothetical protein